jgi:hypothetical protein
MEINIELAKKIISKEYFINGDGGIRTQNPIYLNHLAFLMEKYHQEQLSIAAVSGMLILTPKDAELFFNEAMNPKKANEALKKAMLKFITQ